MMRSLNSTEQSIMHELYYSSKGNGHDFGFTDDVNTTKVGITRRQLSGYISQLAQKGYIKTYSGDPDYDGMFEFTEKGFKYFEAEGK